LGRLEWSRFHSALGRFDGVFRSRFESRLRDVIEDHHIKAIHTIPHTYDIVPISRVASQLSIPYFLTIHDDLQVTSSGHPLLGQMLDALGHAWRNATGLFVISDEIGQEYSRRYGARDYVIVTDGLTSVPDAPLPRPKASLRVYFMGLFHVRYGTNLRALLDALKIVRSQHPDWDISMTCRCGKIFCALNGDDVPVNLIPFAPDESVVETDMLSADLLYQPLPFEPEAANFNRYSMSTKMVTYLGSGLPILYHGPQDAAAYNLLAKNHAAIMCSTLDPEIIAKQLVDAASIREVIVSNALALARSQFMLADQQRRFWGTIVGAL
jgi:hypothetical protein